MASRACAHQRLRLTQTWAETTFDRKALKLGSRLQVKYLLDRNAVVRAKDGNGAEPLHMAAYEGHTHTHAGVPTSYRELLEP
eukprot:1436222-Amphidinium_carterae.1